jgi:hypothetical protein
MFRITGASMHGMFIYSQIIPYTTKQNLSPCSYKTCRPSLATLPVGQIDGRQFDPIRIEGA